MCARTVSTACKAWHSSHAIQVVQVVPRSCFSQAAVWTSVLAPWRQELDQGLRANSRSQINRQIIPPILQRN